MKVLLNINELMYCHQLEQLVRDQEQDRDIDCKETQSDWY